MSKPPALAPEGVATPPLFRASFPLPPSLNRYYLQAKRRRSKLGGGGVYFGRMISPDGRLFRDLVVASIRRGHRAPPRLSGRLSVHVLIAPARNGPMDLDNRWKCLLDALSHAEVVLDDALFDLLVMVRGNVDPAGNGSAALRIDRFDPADHARIAAHVLPEKETPDLLSI